MPTSNLEPLQKRYDEAIHEIALLRRALYLTNASLKRNGPSGAVDIGADIVDRSYYSQSVWIDGAEKPYILELAKLLFMAGIIPSSTIFDEQRYLAENPDVSRAIATKRFKTGFEHWLVHGLSEGRAAASKIAPIDHLSEEVLSVYRSNKIKKAKSPVNFLLRVLMRSRQKTVGST